MLNPSNMKFCQSWSLLSCLVYQYCLRSVMVVVYNFASPYINKVNQQVVEPKSLKIDCDKFNHGLDFQTHIYNTGSNLATNFFHGWREKSIMINWNDYRGISRKFGNNTWGKQVKMIKSHGVDKRSNNSLFFFLFLKMHAHHSKQGLVFTL